MFFLLGVVVGDADLQKKRKPCQLFRVFSFFANWTIAEPFSTPLPSTMHWVNP
jgi:hypothetical protein